MAVFRVERTRDYTVMCNHHLKDSNLSLKAKGLLSMMLSLPDEWNYTARGLAAICKEGVDASGKRSRSWSWRATSSAVSFAARTGAFPTRSTPSSRSPESPLHRIRLYQIRKTRIWITRIRRHRIRIIPRN